MGVPFLHVRARAKFAPLTLSAVVSPFSHENVLLYLYHLHCGKLVQVASFALFKTTPSRNAGTEVDMVPVNGNARYRVLRAAATPAQAIHHCYAPETCFHQLRDAQCADPDVYSRGWAGCVRRHARECGGASLASQPLLVRFRPISGYDRDGEPCLFLPVL